MTEEELLKVFEEYRGYKLEDEDIAGHLQFNIFCTIYQLKEKEK